MSNITQSILNQEVLNALAKGENSLAEASLDNAYKDLYKITTSSCGVDQINILDTKCLFLYLYHLDWLSTNQDDLTIDEEELINILTVVETTSKTCCPTPT